MSQIDVGKIGFTVHDDWTPTAYEKLSLVRHNGATWVSKVGASASDVPSPSSAVWKIVAADSSTSGENVSFLPSGNISATNVSSAIRELDAEKSPINHTHTAANIISSLGYTPVQQGTGIGQSPNPVKIGWSAEGLTATVDDPDLGTIKFKHDTAVNVTDPNFDTIPPGTYHVSLSAQGSAPYPNNGILEVFMNNNWSYRVQRYTTWNELVFVRTMADNSWQPWQEVAHSGRLKTVGGQSLVGSGDIPISSGAFTSVSVHVASVGVLYTNDSGKTAFVVAQINGGDTTTRIGAAAQNDALHYFPAPNGGDYSFTRTVTFMVLPHQNYSFYLHAGTAPSHATFTLWR